MSMWVCCQRQGAQFPVPWNLSPMTGLWTSGRGAQFPMPWYLFTTGLVCICMRKVVSVDVCGGARVVGGDIVAVDVCNSMHVYGVVGMLRGVTQVNITIKCNSMIVQNVANRVDPRHRTDCGNRA